MAQEQVEEEQRLRIESARRGRARVMRLIPSDFCASVPPPAPLPVYREDDQKPVMWKQGEPATPEQAADCRWFCAVCGQETAAAHEVASVCHRVCLVAYMMAKKEPEKPCRKRRKRRCY